MTRQMVFASSLVLALTAGTVPFTSIADAAVARHHGGGHAMGRFGGGHAMGQFRGGHRYAFHRGYGHRDHWARGGRGGGYYGGYYDYCGPIQLALGVCAPYGPYGLL